MSKLLTVAAILFALAASFSFVLPTTAQTQDDARCDNEPATIVAGDAAEVVGTPGRDVIFAANGIAQTIDGQAGDDVICAGPGDTVLAGSGRDLVFADGARLVEGGSGHDDLIVTNVEVVRGGSGNDVFAAFVQPVGTCDGGSGLDVLGFEAGAGCETVTSIEKAIAD